MVIGMNVGHFPEYPTFWGQYKLLKGWPVIRFMDWQQINRFNDSFPMQRFMSDLPNQEEWGYYGGSWHKWNGMPLENILFIANKLRSRAWICVPHSFTAVRQLVDYVCENAALRPIIEYSNESWNAAFGQYHDIARWTLKGKEPENEFRRVIDYHAKRTDQLIRLADGTADVVLCGQARNAWVMHTMLSEMIERPAALAIAPYFRTYDDMEFTIQSVKNHRDIANDHGLPLWAYEIGQHFIENADAANQSAEMADAYSRLLEAVQDDIDIACLYNLASTYTPNHAWGMYRIGGDTIEPTPKLKQVIEKFS
jgi:hypothetical protein